MSRALRTASQARATHLQRSMARAEEPVAACHGIQTGPRDVARRESGTLEEELVRERFTLSSGKKVVTRSTRRDTGSKECHANAPITVATATSPRARRTHRRKASKDSHANAAITVATATSPRARRTQRRMASRDSHADAPITVATATSPRARRTQRRMASEECHADAPITVARATRIRVREARHGWVGSSGMDAAPRDEFGGRRRAAWPVEARAAGRRASTTGAKLPQPA